MKSNVLNVAACLLFAVLVIVPGPAEAQDSPWSVDVGIGWDNSVSGDFLTGAIGTLQAQPVVIDKRTWDDVYGTGVLFNLGVGYTLSERTELRGTFTYQSTGSDDTLTIGSYRGGPLSAHFDNYSAWGLEAGYRRYFAEAAERWRPYAGASLGFGRVHAVRADLAQTGVNFGLDDADFYGSNGAAIIGGNGGVLYRLTEQVSLDARIGVRYVSGLSDVEGPLFTGLDDVNSGSSRWTVPLTIGARVRF